MKDVRFSLIIPARNEEALLPHLLRSVDQAKAQYLGGAGAIEVIVVDNESTDNTARLAHDRGCRVVREEKRIIAAVRNAGAHAAKGSIFAFIDADSQVHPNTFNAIETTLQSGNYVGGASGVKLERMSLGIAMAYIVMVSMVLVMGMDTGVVFCRRKDFEAIGGYNEGHLFAEDVQFLWDLRRLGKKRGQRLIRLTSVKALASTRKFDEFGDWHYFRLLGRFLSSLVFSKDTMKEFAQTYWYGK
jgi:glycosyltransferase involved in cell wall biosynthesis